MVRFLSPEWIDELDRAAASDENLRRSTAGVHLTIEQRIVASEGETVYHVALDDGRVSVRKGPAPAADVTFVQDERTALAVGSGTTTAQEAFMTGRLRLQGDVPLLIRCKDALNTLDDALAGVRARTTY